MLNFNAFEEAFNSIKQHKRRNILTGFGVAWGIFILVTILSAGEGFQQGIIQFFKDFAQNSVWLYGGQSSKVGIGKTEGKYILFHQTDIELLKNRFKEIEKISPEINYQGNSIVSFQDKFTYHINVDDSVGFQTVKIPSMLLQPFIENSIWHGILPSNKPGNIDVNIMQYDNQLKIEIIDDGIGIDNSLNLKKEKKQFHVSKGMELTKNRIELISKISNKACSVTGPFQLETGNKVVGTQVTIIITLY